MHDVFALYSFDVVGILSGAQTGMFPHKVMPQLDRNPDVIESLLFNANVYVLLALDPTNFKKDCTGFVFIPGSGLVPEFSSMILDVVGLRWRNKCLKSTSYDKI